MKNHIAEIIESELKVLDLTPKQKKILRLRAEGKTLKEVGKSFDPPLTMERIRQIQEEAKRRNIIFRKVVKRITNKIKANLK